MIISWIQEHAFNVLALVRTAPAGLLAHRAWSNIFYQEVLAVPARLAAISVTMTLIVLSALKNII